MSKLLFLFFAFALASFLLPPAARAYVCPSTNPPYVVPDRCVEGHGDGQCVCPNTVPTAAPGGGQTFAAYLSHVAGGGSSPAGYAVTEESPAGWVTSVSNFSDGGSWSDYFTLKYDTGVPVVCSATPVQSEGGGFGGVSLQQGFGATGTIGVDFTQNNAQSFFPSADLIITCAQVSQLTAVPSGGGGGPKQPPCKVVCPR